MQLTKREAVALNMARRSDAAFNILCSLVEELAEDQARGVKKSNAGQVVEILREASTGVKKN